MGGIVAIDEYGDGTEQGGANAGKYTGGHIGGYAVFAGWPRGRLVG